MFLSRRRFSTLLSTLFLASVTFPSEVFSAEKNHDDLIKKIIDIEKKISARVGVSIIDTANGKTWNHRADERFPLCSTFKLLAVAAILAKVDAGKEELNRRITYEKKDLVSYSPVTETHLSTGMTLAELCEAAITQSDNTAGNLLLTSLGGPSAITQFSRSLGDTITRLDRMEIELNEAKPADPRDTSSPRAMAGNLQKILLSDYLKTSSREQLKRWLIANKTGDSRLRAGLPQDWIVGDKTGSGGQGSTNDLAIIWPPSHNPIIVSVYITETKTDREQCNTAIADLARALKSSLFS